MNISFSRLSHRFTNLAKYIGPGSIKRYFYPTCRKILRNLRSPVRIYIYIQSNNQKKQGKDFGYRFLWRLVLLAAFATLNAAFFPAGDVLLLFVIVGLVLFFTRNWSDKAILITSIIFLLQPVEWYHYIANLINPAHQLPDLKVGEMYAEVAEYTQAGNFWDFIWGNVTLGQKASLLWAVNAGRFSKQPDYSS